MFNLHVRKTEKQIWRKREQWTWGSSVE